MRRFRFIQKYTHNNRLFGIRCPSYPISILIPLILGGCSPALIMDVSPGMAGSIYVKQIENKERKIKKSSESIHLLTRLTESHTKYAYGFKMEKADRVALSDFELSRKIYGVALQHFSRAIGYGERALSLKYESYAHWILDPQTSKPIFEKEDIPILYWVAAAYGGAVKASFAQPEWLIKLPRVGLLLEEAISLDSNWNYGALHSAMISYTMSRPDAPKNKIEVARHYFDEAIKISGKKDCSPYLALAEQVSRETQNRDEFIQLLNQALDIDKNEVPELRLGNTVSQDRARWLLENIDEFFY